MTKVAVVLSGCGAADGSEIHEAVLTLLALDRAGASYQCLAPDVPQARVVNHITGALLSDVQRNVLQEAARIARGQILSLMQAAPEDYAAVIFPGGYGAAMNLSDFGVKAEDCHIEPSVSRFVQALIAAGKPAGFICIAPTMVAKLYGPGVRLTIGNDVKVAQTLTKMGAVPITCSASEFVVDQVHKVVTTPAYMLARSIGEVALGIEGLVKQVLAMVP